MGLFMDLPVGQMPVSDSVTKRTTSRDRTSRTKSKRKTRKVRKGSSNEVHQNPPQEADEKSDHSNINTKIPGFSQSFKNISQDETLDINIPQIQGDLTPIMNNLKPDKKISEQLLI